VWAGAARIVIGGALLVGLGPGCGKSGGATADAGAGGRGGAGGQADAGSDAGQSLPLAELCAAYTADLCTYLMQCESSDFKDMAQCLAETDCLGVATLMKEVAAGAVGYDPAAAGACQARFQSDPCHFAPYLFIPEVFEVLVQCPGTLTPMRAAGGPCADTTECPTGYFCQRAGKLCPGTCTAFTPLGQACSNGAPCGPGGDCLNGICRPPPKAGDTCASASDCGGVVYTCPADPTCPQNIWCDVAGTHTCQVGVGAGATCGPVSADGGAGTTIACDHTLWCDSALINQSGTCQAFGGAGTRCNQDGCGPGLHCVGFTTNGAVVTLGTCTAPGGNGDPCTFSGDCATGLGCPSGTCVPPVGIGSPCTIDTDCQSGLFCSNSVCLTARYPGDPCGDATSACVHSLCKSGTCVDHAKAGQPCSAGADCVSGTCTSGACVDTSVCAG
jgi:hypothetical protein